MNTFRGLTSRSCSRVRHLPSFCSLTRRASPTRPQELRDSVLLVYANKQVRDSK